MADAPHGWLILDKPRGLGSTQAVGAAHRFAADTDFWAEISAQQAQTQLSCGHCKS